MISLIYDGLTRCLPDGSAELALAERIDLSEDQRIYTFHLREAYWDDGMPVTAYDFEQTWKQIIDPKSGSICAYLFYPIENAEAVYHQTKSLDEVGICALDARTLQVTLERPTTCFVTLTSFPSFLPVPQHKQEASDTLGKRTINGPFYIEKIEAQAMIVLRKNPSYWNVNNLRLDEIQISIIPNEATSFAMFERGELDWLGGLLAPIAPDALASSSAKEMTQYFPMSASTFFAFNTSSAPFSNENIRRAFSLAIDREEIAREILPTHQIPATRCIPPALCGGEDRNLFPAHNAELAKYYLALGLQELGIEKLEPITLHYRASFADRMIAQVIQRKWKDTLNVDLELIQTDFKTHKDLLHTRNFKVALANWIAQYHDPINILERFKNPSNAKNYAAWDDREFAVLIDQALETVDPDLRAELINQAEDLIAEHLPILPVYHWSNPSLCHPRLQNIHTTPSGGVLFERCYLNE